MYLEFILCSRFWRIRVNSNALCLIVWVRQNVVVPRKPWINVLLSILCHLANALKTWIMCLGCYRWHYSMHLAYNWTMWTIRHKNDRTFQVLEWVKMERVGIMLCLDLHFHLLVCPANLIINSKNHQGNSYFRIVFGVWNEGYEVL